MASTDQWRSFEQSMINKMLMQSPVNTPRNPVNRKEDMSGSNSKVYVEHHYVDHYDDPIYRPHDGSSKRRGPRGGVLVPFPEKLYQMLNQIAEDGLDDVCSWQPHGRCFVVHQPERFVKEVMPRYFSQTKLTSFQRQVNLYGFRRLTTGTDRNGYYHELFLRGRPDLLKRMTRVRVKGIGCKLAPSPATEPNLYRLRTCQQNKISTMMASEDSSTPTPKTAKFDSITRPLRPSGTSFVSHYMADKLQQADLADAPKQSLHSWNRAGTFPCTPTSLEAPLPASVQSNPARSQADDDLTPFPTSTASTGYLLDIQDDIINLLSSAGDLSGSTVEPLAALSNSSILNDLANFWEI